jgi:hypothetical protein
MTITKGTALLAGVLCSARLFAQAPSAKAEPFGFQDIHLGMPIAEFKAKHPAPKYGPQASPLPGEALCVAGFGGQPRDSKEDSTTAIVRCDYHELYLSIRLRIGATFVGGRLALIEVKPPSDTNDCFEPPPPAGTSGAYLYSATCQQYPQLLHDMTDKLGQATPIVSTNENLKTLPVPRWESESSVAELQGHMCGAWDGTDQGWSKAISETLKGTYCGQSDVLSYRLTVMLYVDKQLGQTLITRLAN